MSHCLYNTDKVQQPVPTSSTKFWSEVTNLLETSTLEMNSSVAETFCDSRADCNSYLLHQKYMSSFYSDFVLFRTFHVGIVLSARLITFLKNLFFLQYLVKQVVLNFIIVK